jgi:hypothetical protein
MRYFVAGLTVLMLLAAPVDAKEEYNVDFTVGWGGCYRPLRWTPVQVNVSTVKLEEPYQGTVTISAQQDDLNRLVIHHPVVISPDVPLRLPLATKFAFGASNCVVRIRDEKGRSRFSAEYGLWDVQGGSRPIVPVTRDALLIGVVGRAAGRRGLHLTALERWSRCEVPARREEGRVYVRQKMLYQLPWDWTGYDALDLLVLFDPDWTGMKPDQARAIAEWVRGGGRALIVLGANPLPESHPVASLIPFRLGKPRKLTLDEWSLGSLGYGSQSPAEVTCWPLEGRPPFGWRLSHGQDPVPLFAEGPAGFGRVGVLPFDASLGASPDGPSAEQASRFWVKRMDGLLGRRGIEFAGRRYVDRDSGEYWHYELGESAEAANSVLEHLLRIPELRPMSIWVVILLLVGLAVLLGPVDYFVLKKLDRLPLTWVTSGAIIAVFSVAAYYGVEALRAGQMQVRAVSVLDAVQGAGARETLYAGIFAPRSDDYKLGGLDRRQWWSAAAPTQDTYLYGHGSGIGGRHVYCYQADGGNLPYSLPINIWSMQCLVCEAPVAEVPLSATVRRNGDTAEVHIVNRADATIRRGRVRVSSSRWMLLDTVPAGGERTFRGPLRRGGGWSMRGTYGDLDRDAGYFTPPVRNRTDALEKLLDQGAAVVCVEYDLSEVPFDVTGRLAACDHVRLVRLVVLPEEAEP